MKKQFWGMDLTVLYDTFLRGNTVSYSIKLAHGGLARGNTHKCSTTHWTMDMAGLKASFKYTAQDTKFISFPFLPSYSSSVFAFWNFALLCVSKGQKIKLLH